MNWVDLLVLGVLALSGLAGFMRGMVREILSLSAWIAAFLVAWLSYPALEPVFQRAIGNPDIAPIAAGGVVFLLVLIALSLIARMISGAVRRSALGSLDRTLGLVFGLARGAVIAVIAYILGGLVAPVETWPAPVLEARTLPTIYRGAAWMTDLSKSQIPGYTPFVSPPPAARQATADELLRATPQGRAIGSPPARQ